MARASLRHVIAASMPLAAAALRGVLLLTLVELLKPLLTARPPALGAAAWLSWIGSCSLALAFPMTLLVGTEALLLAALTSWPGVGAHLQALHQQTLQRGVPDSARMLAVPAAVGALASLATLPLLGYVLPRAQGDLDFASEAEVVTTYALALLVFPAAAAITAIGVWAKPRMPAAFRIMAPLLLATYAALLSAFAHEALPRLNLDFYIAPALGGALLAAQLAGAFTVVGPTRLQAAALPLAAGMACVLALGAPESLRHALSEKSPFVGRAWALVNTAYDLDGDGYPGRWAGGYDCDDGDPLINPLSPEHVGNGIDENCTGADLASLAPSVLVGTPADTARPNILLLTIDALSARHTSLYGYARNTTPNLQTFATRSLLFEHAYAISTRTEFSVIGLLGGRLPMSTISPGATPRSRAVVLAHGLPEVLSQLGYETTSIFPWNRSLTSAQFANAEWIVDGPGTLIDNTATRTQLAHALARLRQPPGDRPQFVWVHLMDPHGQYIAPPRFGPSPIDRYDAEVAYVDAELGHFFAQMAQTGAQRHTVTLLTADHGEVLDGLSVGHGPMLRPGNSWVPLLIHGPGIAPGKRREAVDSLDIYPTVVQLAAGTLRPGHAHGESLLGPTPTDGLAHAEVFFHLRKQIAMWEGDYKLIINLRRSYRELYDVRTDPAELHNLVDAQPSVADRMTAKLRRWRAARF